MTERQAYRLPAAEHYDLKSNYEHSRFADFVRDAYVHGARTLPGCLARAFDFKAMLLVTRILSSEQFADTWDRHRRYVSRFSESGPDEMRPLLLSGPEASSLAAGPTPPESFACFRGGFPVIDGERVLSGLESMDSASARYHFRSLVLEPYALLLSSAENRTAAGYDFSEWGDVLERIREQPWLFPTMELRGAAREAWVSLFASYYASDTYTQVQLEGDWAGVEGLHAALFIR